MTIYRAHSKDDLGTIHAWSCWADELETAEAYTDNPGFGGLLIRSTDVVGDVLDVNPESPSGLAELAEALGMDADDAQDAGDRWFSIGSRYPWEDSRELRQLLEASAYNWLRYEDDYPEGAITLMAIRAIQIQAA